METVEKLSLGSAAFRGEIDSAQIVEALEDAVGEIGEIRTAMRYLAEKHLPDESKDLMRRAEGLVYAADLALGMARAQIEPDDEAVPREEDGEA